MDFMCKPSDILFRLVIHHDIVNIVIFLAQQAIEQKDANLNVTSIYILLVEPNGSYAPSGAICCSSSTMNHQEVDNLLFQSKCL